MPSNADLRKTTGDLRRSLTGVTPFYAVAGVGDLAVSKLREVPSRVTRLREDFIGEERSLQSRVTDLPSDVRQLPNRLTTFADKRVRRADERYGDLADRGKTMVKRIRNQKATQDLIDQAQSTMTRARIVRGTASRGADDTQTAAKGATTSAKKTARSAGKAAGDAGDKVGTPKSGSQRNS